MRAVIQRALRGSVVVEGEKVADAGPGLVILLGVAALLSVITFRILQPYAFSGPGLFGVRLNPLWVENIQSQRAQASRMLRAKARLRLRTST